MECFVHANVAAVATCKVCGRAVCCGCAKDLAFAVACSDACVKEAQELRELAERSKRMYGVGSNSKAPRFTMATIAYSLFAILFAVAAIFTYVGKRSVDPILVLFAVFFSVIAILAYSRSRKFSIRY